MKGELGDDCSTALGGDESQDGGEFDAGVDQRYRRESCPFVDPTAQTYLLDFDTIVTHHSVVVNTLSGLGRRAGGGGGRLATPRRQRHA